MRKSVVIRSNKSIYRYGLCLHIFVCLSMGPMWTGKLESLDLAGLAQFRERLLPGAEGDERPMQTGHAYMQQ